MPHSERPGHSSLVMALILLGVVARLVPHPWNATPTMAIALFAGTYLSKRWATILPLVIVASTDFLLGWHATVPFTWGAFVLTGMLAWWVRQRPGPWRILGGVAAGSSLFFLLTNFGVWLTGELYPWTADGLWRCYVAAVPFFRSTLAGDLIFTAAFFGGYAVLTGREAGRSTLPSA